MCLIVTFMTTMTILLFLVRGEGEGFVGMKYDLDIMVSPLRFPILDR